MPYYRLFYHFVWATKGRLPLLDDGNRKDIYAVIAAKVVEAKGIVHAVGGMADHVHLVVTLPPSTAPSALIAQVKGASSHLAARLGPGEGSPFAWQSDYGLVSLSESHLPRVVAYVHGQARHHAEISLLAELEAY